MSGILLQMSAVCVLPITLCNLTGSILNALNLEVKSFVNYIIGSLVLFACLIVFTPLVGINSVTISFFASMSVISLLNINKIKKAVPNFKFNLINVCFKYFLIVIPSSLLGHFVSNIFLHILNNFFSAVIGGGTSILSTLILCKMFNIYDLQQVFDLIFKKKRKV